jgi:ApaG protein
METLITKGIKVSVETFFQGGHSNQNENKFIHAYRITIENLGTEESVQLLRRHWMIFDSNSEVKEVEGEGVIGQQPIIEPGGQHQYVSLCNLQTTIGKMYGSYEMLNLSTGKTFHVDIPKFDLIAPFLLN